MLKLKSDVAISSVHIAAKEIVSGWKPNCAALSNTAHKDPSPALEAGITSIRHAGGVVGQFEGLSVPAVHRLLLHNGVIGSK
jgi:hypothetical protein